ncbi:hypothetical protein GCM10029992_28090 [Glycomyces albus]
MPIGSGRRRSIDTIQATAKGSAEMDYLINFATGTDPQRVKDVVLERWNLDPASIYAGTADDMGPGPSLDVMILHGQAPARTSIPSSKEAMTSPQCAGG